MIVAEGGWNLGVTKGASDGVCTSLRPKSLRLKISLLSKPKLGLLTAFCGMGLMGLFRGNRPFRRDFKTEDSSSGIGGCCSVSPMGWSSSSGISSKGFFYNNEQMEIELTNLGNFLHTLVSH